MANKYSPRRWLTNAQINKRLLKALSFGKSYPQTKNVGFTARLEEK